MVFVIQKSSQNTQEEIANLCTYCDALPHYDTSYLSCGPERGETGRLEISVDLLEVIDKLALQIVPHLRLVLCVSIR